MLKHLKAQQRSNEWFEARLGVITASKIGKCFTGKLKKSQAGITSSIASLTTDFYYKSINQIPETFTPTKAMQWGIDHEPEAFEVAGFEFYKNDLYLRETGFWYDSDRNIGCSPDGLIYTDEIQSGLEIKCPQIPNHLEYISIDKCPNAYYPQLQFSMYVMGLNSWHFMSYFPIESDPFMICKVERDDEFIEEIKSVIDEINVSLETNRKVIGI